jgi:hypothetical protein
MANIKLKILLVLAIIMIATASFGQVQYGGQIQAQNNSGTASGIRRNLDALKVYDSALYNKINSGIPVTGTFFQATQPVSGTFWQTTQPVSIASMPSTPVTGTFFQSTQPVSIAASVAVTGSFFQGTQPVSIAAALAIDSTKTRIQSQVNVLNFPSTQPISAASLPLPTNASQETGGNLATIVTNTNKLPSLGQATMANSQPNTMASDEIILKVTGQSAQTATVNNILTASSGTAATDVSLYRSFAIQVNSTATGGAYIFEGSVDNTNFVSIPVYNAALLVPVPVITAITASATNIIYVGSTQFPFIRLRISTLLTGGSIQAFGAFSPNPLSTAQIVMAQGTAANLLATVTVASGTVTTVSTVTTVTTLSQFLASAAAADATANPTTTGVRGFGHFYNGSTWDRQHGNWNTTTGDAGAKIANGTGATQTNFDSRGATVTVLLGTITGSFTTFQTQLQWSPDAGTTWINYGPAQANLTTPVSGNTFTFQVYPNNQSLSGATPSALTLGSTQQVLINDVLPRTWRLTWTIAGTSPSATITGVYVNYQL